jgi:MFS family permease
LFASSTESELPCAATSHAANVPARGLRDFWGLTGAIAMVGLALGTVLPLSAVRLEQDGHGSATIGLLLALHALGQVMALPLTMPLVRRWGGRRALQGASLGAALTCMLLQATPTPWVMGLALLGLGLQLGLVFNLSEAWVNVILPDAQRGRWLALHCTLFTVFQLCGPLLLPHLPLEREFYLCGALLLLALPACQRLGTSPIEEEPLDTPAAAPPWWHWLREAPAIVWSTALFALFDAVVLGLLPLHARQQGFSDTQALLSASVVLAGDTCLEWCVGWLGDRFGCRPVQWLCALFLLASAALLPLAAHLSWLWWPLLFAMGGAAGGLYVLSLLASGQRYRGLRLLHITAVLGATWGAASSIGPLLTGVLMQWSPTWALPGVLLLMTTILLMTLRLEGRHSAVLDKESSA